MVTPTFAAGLGVVIAAALVYPMSRPVFRYSPPGWGGQRCPAPGCVAAGGGAGSPAVAKPGRRLETPPVRDSRPGSSGPLSSLGAQPVVSYQTVRAWSGGFQGLLTLTFRGDRVPARWGLWFGYQRGRVLGVAGSSWRPRHGGHTAAVTSQRYDRPRHPDGAIRVGFWASGAAGRPDRCSFDGQPCRYR